MKFLLAASLALTGLLQTCSSLPSIEIQGNYFKNPLNDGQFQIIGTAYVLTNSTTSLAALDALVDPGACLRDAALLQRAGVNTIYVWGADPTLSHDQCVSIFNAVGIYILISLDWNETSPAVSNSPGSNYNLGYMQNTFAVIDAFKDYENVLGFFVSDGNALTNLTTIPLYLRALIRDTKEYIERNSPRAIPVGFSVHLDDGGSPDQWYPYLSDFWEYTQCNTSSDGVDLSRTDFFSFEDTHYCPGSGSSHNTAYNESGWEAYNKNYSTSSVPVFFSQYGCYNISSPEDDSRNFSDTAALYDPNYMSNTFSGGLLFEYANSQLYSGIGDLGLVLLDFEGNIQLRKDYDLFSNVLHQFNLPELGAGVLPISSFLTSTVSVPTCTSALISDPATSGFPMNWSSIPTPPPGVANLITFGNNGTRGQIVDVVQTSVTHVVRDVSGSVITGLVITVSPSSPMTTTGTTGGSHPSITASNTPPPSIAKSSNKDVKIGVGVGVPLGVIALAGLGFLIFWLRRKAVRRRYTATQSTDTGEKTSPSVPAYSPVPGELETVERREIYGYQRPGELDGEEYRELDGRGGSFAELDSGSSWPRAMSTRAPRGTVKKK